MFCCKRIAEKRLAASCMLILDTGWVVVGCGGGAGAGGGIKPAAARAESCSILKPAGEAREAAAVFLVVAYSGDERKNKIGEEMSDGALSMI